MTKEHDTSGALTCPNCGTSGEDHAVMIVSDDMGACNACGAVWNESDKAVKRIRALESDLFISRDGNIELNQIITRLRSRLAKAESNKRGMETAAIYWYDVYQDESARLAAEVEQLKGR